jgi:hypothetical protein
MSDHFNPISLVKTEPSAAIAAFPLGESRKKDQVLARGRRNHDGKRVGYWEFFDGQGRCTECGTFDDEGREEKNGYWLSFHTDDKHGKKDDPDHRRPHLLIHYENNVENGLSAEFYPYGNKQLPYILKECGLKKAGKKRRSMENLS